MEIIKKNDIVKLVLVLAAIYVFVVYVKPMFNAEKFEDTDVEEEMAQGQVEDETKFEEFEAAEQQDAAEFVGKMDSEEVLKAEDLLPKYDDANAFAKENPVSKLLKEQNFLISGHHVGVNTVMQSNKIPYLDIRSLPPIPKENVGPWNQSSFEQSPGNLRRGLEIV